MLYKKKPLGRWEKWQINLDNNRTTKTTKFIRVFSYNGTEYRIRLDKLELYCPNGDSILCKTLKEAKLAAEAHDLKPWAKGGIEVDVSPIRKLLASIQNEEKVKGEGYTSNLNIEEVNNILKSLEE